MTTTSWTEAASVAAIGNRMVPGVELDGRHIALYRLKGGDYATADSLEDLGA